MGQIASIMSESVSKYGLKFIRPYHREIARRLVLGESQSDICRDLGMSTSRMSIIVNSPLFKIELRKLEEARDNGVVDISHQLKEMAPGALEIIERTMFQSKGKLRFMAAQDILDRAGVTKKTEIGVHTNQTVTHNLSIDELRKLVRQRIDKVNQEASKVEEDKSKADAIEVKFEDVIDEFVDKGCSDNEHKQSNFLFLEDN
jgi:hypothetical protein